MLFNQMFPSRLRHRLQKLGQSIITQRWYIGEGFFVFLVWYLVFGRVWNGSMIPGGGEYARSMSPFFFWESLQSCIGCSFWAPHGGGKPILADPFGSFLHPISMLFSLGLGAVAGASLTESAAFLIVAFAAYSLAMLLDFSRITRVWFSIASMIGGHVVCRLEIGSIGLPLSYAALFTAYVVVYWYLQQPSDRRALIVGVAVGALLTAGQMYYQYFFLLTLMLWSWVAIKRGYLTHNPAYYRHLGIGGGIACLIAAPLFLNLFATMGIYGKLTDPDARFSISIGTQIINFLLPSIAVARTDLLNPYPYPYAYATYIGVLPLIVALVWYQRIERPADRVFAQHILIGVGLAMVLATGIFTKIALLLQNDTISFVASSFRFVVLYNGIAAQGILVLAALGVDAVVRNPGSGNGLYDRFCTWCATSFSYNPRISIVAVLAAYHLLGLHSYAQQYITAQPLMTADTTQIARAVAALPAGYIDAPNWLLLPIMRQNQMAATYFSSVTLENRKFPPAQYFVTQKVPDTIPTTVLQQFPGDWKLVRNDAADQQYASVTSDGTTYVPCSATQQGGEIRVLCDTDKPGQLRVLVNAIRGWEYSRDAAPYTSHPEATWLQVAVPAGQSTVLFRYTPWYAVVGLWLIPISWLAVALCVLLMGYRFRKQRPLDA